MYDVTNKPYWQRMAKLYAPFMKSAEPLYDSISKRCRLYLTSEMNVLELACGSGQFSFRLADCTGRWEATDFSEKMIAEAQKNPRPQNLTFEVRDATKLPYSSASFDAVFIGNALHIMPEPNKAVTEICRVLRPGGILFAPTFIWGGDIRQQFSEWLMKHSGFHVFHKWSAEEFIVYLESFGFQVLECEIMGGSIRPLCCVVARGVLGS